MARKTLQLGQPTALPASPAEAVLDRVPNPHPDTNYVARFTSSSAVGTGLLYDDTSKVYVGATSGGGLFNVGTTNQFQVSSAVFRKYKKPLPWSWLVPLFTV